MKRPSSPWGSITKVTNHSEYFHQYLSISISLDGGNALFVNFHARTQQNRIAEQSTL